MTVVVWPVSLILYFLSQPMNISKYDRQIRLIGKDTQERLFGMTVQVLGTTSAISSEVIKNLVLLGIKKLVVTKDAINEIKKYVPDNLSHINPNLNLEINESLTRCDFIFEIDCKTAGTNKCHICSNCLYVDLGSTVHECETNQPTKYNEECLLAVECLLGAYAVQEFLKYVGNQPLSGALHFNL